MNPEEIRKFLEAHKVHRERTMVIVDFGNVVKWENSLRWKVGVPELAKFIKHLAYNDKQLRRFYYGSDYGPFEKRPVLSKWSEQMLQHAQFGNLEPVTKRVKYMPNHNNPDGYDKKCDLDVEMTVDLIKNQEKYDKIFLFSGDGDLVCALKYINEDLSPKEIYVFGARGHVGREVIDAERAGLVKKVFYAEDFEGRFKYGSGRGGGAHANRNRPYWLK